MGKLFSCSFWSFWLKVSGTMRGMTMFYCYCVEYRSPEQKYSGVNNKYKDIN